MGVKIARQRGGGRVGGGLEMMVNGRRVGIEEELAKEAAGAKRRVLSRTDEGVPLDGEVYRGRVEEERV